jgi:hypothetical protein
MPDERSRLVREPAVRLFWLGAKDNVAIQVRSCLKLDVLWTSTRVLLESGDSRCCYFVTLFKPPAVWQPA